MALSLSRRLVWSGIATSEEVAAALFAHVTTGVAFLQALAERSPRLARALDREFSRGIEDRPIDPAIEWIDRLPAGICRALSVVPYAVDADGTLLVAAVDAGDHHAATEIAFHLNVPVRLVPASFAAVSTALFGQAPTWASVPAPAPAPRASDAPIPLVRMSGSESPATVPGVPPAEGRAAATAILAGSLAPQAKPSDPVISLTRSKPSLAPARAPVAHEPDRVFEELEHAASPGDVASALARGMELLAERVVVFAVRATKYEGREASGNVSLDEVRDLRIAAESPSVLRTACEQGHYVGPLPLTVAHGALAAALGGGDPEVSVTPVVLSARPALVLVASGFENTFLVTERAERLCRAAGKALERIVRDRKR